MTADPLLLLTLGFVIGFVTALTLLALALLEMATPDNDRGDAQ